MNNSEFASLVSDAYKKSFIEIMENYQCEVHECEGCRGVMEFSSCVTIDAGAKDFEMCIALKMPYSSLEQSIPSKLTDGLVSECQLEDWLCEISNLLIGSVKADLLKRNCKLQIGLPHCSVGEELGNIVPDGYEHSKYHFTVEHDCCESIVSLQFFKDQIDCLDSSLDEDETTRSELELF